MPWCCSARPNHPDRGGEPVRHINIPIFVPHEGCPNDCVFCNQRSISGRRRLDLSDARAEIESVLSTAKDAYCEIAFFGGSFTGIERDRMHSLLELAGAYRAAGRVGGIRLSTRPDYIDGEILELLREYRVTAIELGVQSMSPAVLHACRRGHTPEDSRRAAALIRRYGFELVCQMMIGLCSSGAEEEEDTARQIVRLRAHGARIYPTVVFAGTPLAEMAERGAFSPLSPERSLDRTYRAFRILTEGGVRVIRTGLCSNELLQKGEELRSEYDGAIGERVASRYYYDLILDKLQDRRPERLTVVCPPGETSKITGHKKENKEKLKKIHGVQTLAVTESDRLKRYSVELLLP